MNRKLIHNFYIIFIAGILLCFQAQAQQIQNKQSVVNPGDHLLTRQGKMIVNQLGDTILLRGMGLGGWMLQEGYMLQTGGFAGAQYQIKDKISQLLGASDTELFYEAWLENHVRKIDMDSLKSWGFNSVRLPLHYNLFTLPIEDEPVPGEQTWLTKGFELTDSLISWCSQNEMYVILDLHAAPGGQGYNEGISDYDPTKPSLWESPYNRQKTVALWKKLAGRYATEQWLAGYDLLNEPNWDLPGNTALRQLYIEITDSIRTVDPDHLLFIEGNWFANDFTAMTPPWDNQIVYAPHKYWSYNDEASIDWVLSIQNTYNVPLWFGEFGENSNVWMRNAIRLFEDHNIGWAMWPMKKIESISCPTSIVKSPEYQVLLNYWNGNGANPGSAYAKTALMDLTEKLKLENCVYQNDFIDAVFRQVNTDETLPFAENTVPGIIYASDYDLGRLNYAYGDSDFADYQVNTGSFAPWNNGWAYRNDGVDIEECSDIMSTNGYNIGFIKTGEWMKYSINVQSPAVYEVDVRVASGAATGKFMLKSKNSALSDFISISNTGGWQNWSTVFVYGIVLYPEDDSFAFYVKNEGFNLSSFKFIETGPVSSVPGKFVSAQTEDYQQIRLGFNKYLNDSSPVYPGDFQVNVNGEAALVTSLSFDPDNKRSILLDIDIPMNLGDLITVTYDGQQLSTTDSAFVEAFYFKEVENTLAYAHEVPGKIEAEDFFVQSGIEIEETSDAGGGYNIAYLDEGDYLDYHILVESNAIYTVEFRTASQWASGAIDFQLADSNGVFTSFFSSSFSPTGDWQNWVTSSSDLYLPKGYHVLRMLITQQAPFNMNWFRFSSLIDVPEVHELHQDEIAIRPNPFSHLFMVDFQFDETEDINLQVLNTQGQIIRNENLFDIMQQTEVVDLKDYPPGIYFVKICKQNVLLYRSRIVKLK